MKVRNSSVPFNSLEQKKVLLLYREKKTLKQLRPTFSVWVFVDANVRSLLVFLAVLGDDTILSQRVKQLRQNQYTVVLWLVVILELVNKFTLFNRSILSAITFQQPALLQVRSKMNRCIWCNTTKLVNLNHI